MRQTDSQTERERERSDAIARRDPTVISVLPTTSFLRAATRRFTDTGAVSTGLVGSCGGATADETVVIDVGGGASTAATTDRCRGRCR